MSSDGHQKRYPTEAKSDHIVELIRVILSVQSISLHDFSDTSEYNRPVPKAHLAGFGRWMRQLQRSEETIRVYTQYLEIFFAHLESNEWTSDGLAWLAWQATPSSRRMTGYALRSFADFCEEFGVLGGGFWSPKRLPKISPPCPDPASFSNVRAILRASKTRYPGKSGRSFRGWVLLIWASGARRSEASNLKVTDISVDQMGSEVWVLGKGNKTRRIPIPRLLAKALVCGPKGKDPLWPGDRAQALTGHDLARMWRQCSSAAKVPRTRVHQMRHTKLTEWSKTESPWTFSLLSGQKDLNSSRHYVKAQIENRYAIRTHRHELR